jgi:hypothetical protein
MTFTFKCGAAKVRQSVSRVFHLLKPQRVLFAGTCPAKTESAFQVFENFSIRYFSDIPVPDYSPGPAIFAKDR